MGKNKKNSKKANKKSNVRSSESDTRSAEAALAQKNATRRKLWEKSLFSYIQKDEDFRAVAEMLVSENFNKLSEQAGRKNEAFFVKSMEDLAEVLLRFVFLCGTDDDLCIESLATLSEMAVLDLPHSASLFDYMLFQVRWGATYDKKSNRWHKDKWRIPAKDTKGAGVFNKLDDLYFSRVCNPSAETCNSVALSLSQRLFEFSDKAASKELIKAVREKLCHERQIELIGRVDKSKSGLKETVRAAHDAAQCFAAENDSHKSKDYGYNATDYEITDMAKEIGDIEWFLYTTVVPMLRAMEKNGLIKPEHCVLGKPVEIPAGSFYRNGCYLSDYEYGLGGALIYYIEKNVLHGEKMAEYFKRTGQFLPATEANYIPPEEERPTKKEETVSEVNKIVYKALSEDDKKKARSLAARKAAATRAANREAARQKAEREK